MDHINSEQQRLNEYKAKNIQTICIFQRNSFLLSRHGVFFLTPWRELHLYHKNEGASDQVTLRFAPTCVRVTCVHMLEAQSDHSPHCAAGAPVHRLPPRLVARRARTTSTIHTVPFGIGLPG